MFSPRRPLPVLAILLSIPCGGAIHSSEGQDDTSSRRAALAVRGGASLGAYEAGLNWAALKVLRLTHRNVDWPLGGKPRVIDLVGIAGTSAGGINALLSGLTWCAPGEGRGGLSNTIEDNIFRDVWLMPDVNRLLPPDADSPLYLPDDAALARRDFVDIAAHLRETWTRAGALRPGCRVPLGVTVTRVQPEKLIYNGIELSNQRFYIPMVLRVEEDGSAAFFFDREDYPALDDPAMMVLPRSAEAEPNGISDQQVIDAILTTSAFPTAFGRKRLKYCRPKRTMAEEETKTPEGGLVCPDGRELAEAAFADGGLFDNLPIGLARLLAERSRLAAGDPLPVTYVFMDPGRTRFDEPDSQVETACQGDDPPAACDRMPFNFASEAAVLRGALGTARQYELFREMTSAHWSANLASLGPELADVLDRIDPAYRCPDAVPYFEGELRCSDRLRRASKLLTTAYGYTLAPIAPPVSVDRLIGAGAAARCVEPPTSVSARIEAECELDEHRLRARYGEDLARVAAAAGPEAETVLQRIERSRSSMLEDRRLELTSRAAPVTGSLLGAFGAFLEHQFREYDYFLGVYDGVLLTAHSQCALYLSPEEQAEDYGECLDRISDVLQRELGVPSDPRARYVYALSAKREFGDRGWLRYAYSPMPAEDRNFRIIHEGLERTLQAGEQLGGEIESSVSVERAFFDYLQAEGFEPTPSDDGEEPLLALIMAAPEHWSHEMIKRWTTRIVELERQAGEIFEEREPDPAKRRKANTAVLGAGAWVLQTGTYRYPPRAFAPSTAPKAWLWRNAIPYEVAYDFSESDLLFLWQPTFNAGRVNLGLRFGFGFAGGLVRSSANKLREHYGTFGLDFTVLTKSTFFSGWGVTPAVYHAWRDPEVFSQTTAGFDVHAGFLKNRFRLGVGTRDVNNFEDNWFLTLSVADVPGAIYWLTR